MNRIGYLPGRAGIGCVKDGAVIRYGKTLRAVAEGKISNPCQLVDGCPGISAIYRS